MFCIYRIIKICVRPTFRPRQSCLATEAVRTWLTCGTTKKQTEKHFQLVAIDAEALWCSTFMRETNLVVQTDQAAPVHLQRKQSRNP